MASDVGTLGHHVPKVVLKMNQTGRKLAWTRIIICTAVWLRVHEVAPGRGYYRIRRSMWISEDIDI
jgi:hypothetical protein